jgi:hypothetical protein
MVTSDFQVSVDPVRRRITFHYQEAQTIEDWLAAMDRALAHPDYRAGFDVLVDRRGGIVPSSTSFIHTLADYVRAHHELHGIRWAAVVDQPATYGMARMWEALVEDVGLETHIFRSLDEAEQWLGRARAG